MVGSIAARRAKTKRGRREILKHEPKMVENPKVLACLRGHATSSVVNGVLKEFYSLRRPLAKSFTRKNSIRPFEAAGEAPLEALLAKNDCSLFMLGNHTKKRPHNLILGRLFDGHLLDMVEFGIEDFVSLEAYTGRKRSLGIKPCVVFKGDFSSDPNLEKVKNLLLDVFRGPNASEVDLAGLEAMVTVEVKDGPRIVIRHHRILLKKSGGRLPRVELEDTGPTMELSIRRSQFAAPELMKMALRQPKGLKSKKVKNISYEEGLGDTVGKVHVQKQDMKDLALRKMKGLRKGALKAAEQGENENDNAEN
ncbi:hypothetical protein NDN08_006657 [Rhodosorus marinus]|uniref:Ribosome production factor 2 homolog n=1 Tax=Rhodosorus marinus TaxID=101924 RepID=A0AAV8UI82_9RHOD|nr:hypothetical protein NDN08_006657 [Rhodosorus marinus]